MVNTSTMFSKLEKEKRQKNRPFLLPDKERKRGMQQYVAQAAVEVRFGVPSKNCDNYGICQIEMNESLFEPKAGSPAETNCCIRKGGAVMTLEADGGIELAFPKSCLSPKVVSDLFSKPFFEMEEDYVLPENLVPENTPASKWRFAAGRYPIVETQGFYILFFK